MKEAVRGGGRVRPDRKSSQASRRSKETRTEADSPFCLNDSRGAPPTLSLPSPPSVFPGSSDLSSGHWWESPAPPRLSCQPYLLSFLPTSLGVVGRDGVRGRVEEKTSRESLSGCCQRAFSQLLTGDTTCLTSVHAVDTVALRAVLSVVPFT